MKKYVLLYLFLVAFAFQTQAGTSIKDHFEPEIWEHLKTKFLYDSIPIRYHSNILIRLDGKPTRDDQNIVKKYASMLDSLIDVWDVYVIESGTANLVLEFNSAANQGKENQVKFRNNSREIVESHVVLNIPPNTLPLQREKIIYYYLIRSLAETTVIFDRASHMEPSISGAVFDEKVPAKITFRPIDKKIIKALYSKVFDDKKNYAPTSLPIKRSVKPENRFQYKIAAELLAVFLGMLYLIIASTFGIFKKHDYDFAKFFRQGLFVTLGYLTYFSSRQILISLFTLQTFFLTPHLAVFVTSLIFAIIAIILIYSFESIFLANKNASPNLRTTIPFITTTLIPTFITMSVVLLANHYSNTKIPVLDLGIKAVSFGMIIAVSRTFFIFMNLRAENAIKQKDLQLAKLNELHKQAELKSLQSKINPHFLYNALNSIASLSKSDPEKTEKMALALSDFFKYSLNKEQKQMVSLREELESVETYLTIEKVRFDDRLHYQIDCPAELKDAQIPQFIIQPIVENSIKHGISKLTNAGEIHLAICDDKKRLVIQIHDNGPDFPNEPISGYGLQSIHEKLNLLYGAKAFLKWQNNPEKKFIINLPLKFSTHHD